MKNNNLVKKLLSVVTAFVLVFAMSSCNQDLMNTTFTPDNNDVTFSTPSAKYTLNGEPLVVTLQRGVAKEAISVKLTLNDPAGVYTLSSSSVSFAADEYVKEVTLSYETSKLKPVTDYAFTLSFDAKDKAAGGYNSFSASALMPLNYQEKGVAQMVGNYLGNGFAHKLYIAEHTQNYYMIENVAGSGLNFEFNTVGGEVNITAPAFSAISGLIAKGLKFASPTIDVGVGPVTFWLDCDPAYILTALDSNGYFSPGAIIQFDAIYQMGGSYYGWYKVQFKRVQ